ncbi:MAG: MATE family efflux transporter [Muribaculaceae bacterium]|nr:MATE family efflux transporter [Muribaculaceae bacterium]
MDKTDSPQVLGTKPVGKLLLEYSVPAVIASVVTSLYNIVDSIFIGQGVGAMAITGLALTFPMMNLLIAFVMVVAVGGATVTSIYLGQKDNERASNALGTVMLLCLIHSVVFGGISLWLLDDILHMFGATDRTLPYAREFMRVLLFATPVSFVFIGLNNMMRASGYPRKAMISALLSVGVNVILCPIFIFVFNWGIKGAACATVCGQSVACIWVLAHFFSHKSFINFHKVTRWFSGSIARMMYTIGLSPFLINVCACVVVMFINKSLIAYGGEEGDMAVGAFGIVNRVTMLFLMIVMGVTQGMQPILGYNYGAGRWDRVKRCLWLGIYVGSAITILGFALTEFFPEQVTRLFTDDALLIGHSIAGFHIILLCYPVIGAAIVIQNFFQSIGKPQLSIFLSMTRQLLYLLPLLWVLPKYWGVDGVWASMAGSDFLAFLTTIITLWIVLRKFNKSPHARISSTSSDSGNGI